MPAEFTFGKAWLFYVIFSALCSDGLWLQTRAKGLRAIATLFVQPKFFKHEKAIIETAISQKTIAGF